jgi:hypothetical protein
MRPTKTLATEVGALALDEIERRERPDDVVEMNVAVVLWDDKRASVWIRSGTAELERRLRKAVHDEGQ